MAASALVPAGLLEQERHVQKSLLSLTRGSQISPKVREELDARVKRSNPEWTLERVVTSALKSQEIGGQKATMKSLLKGGLDQPATGATGWNMLQGIAGTSNLTTGARNNMEIGALNYIYGLIATDPRELSQSVPDAVQAFSSMLASSGMVSFVSNGVQLVQWVPVKEASGALEGTFGEFTPENWSGYKDATTSFTLAMEGLNHVVSQGLAQESRGGLASFAPGLRELGSLRTFGLPWVLHERSPAAISLHEARTLMPQLNEMDAKQLQSLQGGRFVSDPTGSGDLVFVKNNWSSSPIVKGISMGSGVFANAVMVNGEPLRLSRANVVAAAAYVENRDSIDQISAKSMPGAVYIPTKEEQVVRDVRSLNNIQKKLEPYYLSRPKPAVIPE
jgi:hypothetical protein